MSITKLLPDKFYKDFVDKNELKKWIQENNFKIYDIDSSFINKIFSLFNNIVKYHIYITNNVMNIKINLEENKKEETVKIIKEEII